MPKNPDIASVLVIGAGPIIIGQGCEFDYSGTQACKSLREEGVRVILINSNPATFMTNFELADKTYVEPLTLEFIQKIIEKEKPDAILPTVGGQVGLNLSLQMQELDLFKKYGIKLLGPGIQAIQNAECRNKFQELMVKNNLPIVPFRKISSVRQALETAQEFGFPVVTRSSFNLGGTGSILVRDEEHLTRIVENVLRKKQTSVSLEKSILGWQEFELELIKDEVGTCIVVCSIENFDPIGIHTGDSICVAPQQTLSDQLYQKMRKLGIQVMHAVGINNGAANVQFAVHPTTQEMVVVEINPRVSRSSALASKASGYPIAKIATKLSLGYLMEEIKNTATGVTLSCFEPVMDYVIIKLPRFDDHKFSNDFSPLGMEMRSVGEVMCFGRSFKESLQKALQGLDKNIPGFNGVFYAYAKGLAALTAPSSQELIESVKERIDLKNASFCRLSHLKDAIKVGMSVEEIYQCSMIHPWFLHQLQDIVRIENIYLGKSLLELSKQDLLCLKQNGFSDEQIAIITSSSEEEVFLKRKEIGVMPGYHMVDTCACEFDATTPYHYACYGEGTNLVKDTREKVIILGSGANRIGQGLEFDTMCVQAAQTLREKGICCVMLNCNPETVSTDYDVSDIMIFEPVTLESLFNVVNVLSNVRGVIIQFGGQTPLNFAKKLDYWKIPVLGTSPKNICLAEDRSAFRLLLKDLKAMQPENYSVSSKESLIKAVEKLGFPVVLRPSFVLGGQSMRIAHTQECLDDFWDSTGEASTKKGDILVEKYLQNAIELDVDAICDQKSTFVYSIMEHIESAGVHSGDSSGILPSINISPSMKQAIIEITNAIALRLQICGLVNIQFAIQQENLFVIEVNTRGSRTIPFATKAMGKSWVQIATKILLGETLADFQLKPPIFLDFCVKSCVFPFEKFPGSVPLLGPEMKSTGESIGIGKTVEMAFHKAEMACSRFFYKDRGILLRICPESDLTPIMSCLQTFSGKEKVCFYVVSSHPELNDRLKALESQYNWDIQEVQFNQIDFLFFDEKVGLVINLASISKPLDVISLRMHTLCFEFQIALSSSKENLMMWGKVFTSLNNGAQHEVVALQDRTY